ncbi:hypothetical protein ACQJBY_004760 [Aegilops geniculata]
MPSSPLRRSAASTLQNHRHRPSYPSYHAARTTMVTGQHPSRELRPRASRLPPPRPPPRHARPPLDRRRHTPTSSTGEGAAGSQIWAGKTPAASRAAATRDTRSGTSKSRRRRVREAPLPPPHGALAIHRPAEPHQSTRGAATSSRFMRHDGCRGGGRAYHCRAATSASPRRRRGNHPRPVPTAALAAGGEDDRPPPPVAPSLQTNRRGAQRQHHAPARGVDPRQPQCAGGRGCPAAAAADRPLPTPGRRGREEGSGPYLQLIN